MDDTTKLKVSPSTAAALGAVNAAINAGDIATAERRCREALGREPDAPALLHALAVVQDAQMAKIAARDSLARACEVASNNADLASALGMAELRIGHIAAAEAPLRKACELNPGHATAMAQLGNTLRYLGRMEDAQEVLRRAHTLVPRDVSVLIDLCSAIKPQPGSAEATRLSAMADDSHYPAWDRSRAHLALADLYDAVDDVVTAWRHMTAGNALAHHESANALADHWRREADVRSVFASGVVNYGSDSGTQDDTPVFIIGLPRSGTTLVEQILASHNNVYGAGEITTLGDDLSYRLAKTGLDQFPYGVPEMDATAFKQFASDYLAHIRRFSGSAKRIINKMPDNRFFIGVIGIAFPNAKVIHCHRNPVANCFSLLRQFFSENIPYANDMEAVARAYAENLKLMDHWHALLPGFVYDVSYEDLVREPEKEIRALLNHCGLPWDPQCLSFHMTKRPVATASSSQVRKTLSPQANDAWRRYEEMLSPLLRSLERHGVL